MKQKVNREMGDYILQRVSQFSRLATVGSVLEEQTNIALSLSSLSEWRE